MTARTLRRVEAALLEHVARARSARNSQQRRAPARRVERRAESRRGARRPASPSDRPRRSPVSSGRSTRISTTPCAARRSPYGSREPVGLSPAANRPTIVSSLSASDTAAQVTAALPSCVARRRRVGLDADRQVVEVDRLPHLLGQAFLARVDAAHRALQLGELADHVGRQIGLREPRRLRGVRRASPRRRRAPRARSSRPAARCARPSPCRCRASCGTAACRAARCRDSSGALRSASQKKRASRSRAVTTRSALRAMVRSLSGSVLMTARNAFFSLPVLVLDRKVVLMMNQRRRQHFLGQLEELVRERAGDDRRVLDQVGHFVAAARTRCATVRLTRPCSRCAFASSSRAILLWRSLRSRMTKFSSSRARYSSNVLHLDRAAGAAAGRRGTGGRRSTAPDGRPAPAGSAPPACGAIVNGTTRPP